MAQHELKIGRRDVLRGLGTGVALLSPLLKGVIAHAAGESPMYTVIVPVQHGFGSIESSYGLDNAMNFVAELRAFDALKSKTLRIDGVTGHFGAPPFNSHDASYTDILTASGVFGRGGSGQFLDPSGPSIDGFLEAKLPGTRVLRFSGNYSSFGQPYHPLSWSVDKKKLPYLTDYKSLINAIQARVVPSTPGGPSTPPAKAFSDKERRRLILDSVKSDANTLKNRLPASLRAPLDQKIDAIAQAHMQLALDVNDTPTMPPVDSVKCVPLDASLVNGPGPVGNDYTQVIGNVMSAVRAGIVCNTHNVFVIAFGDHYGGYKAVRADGTQFDANLSGDYHHQAAHGEGGADHQAKHRGRVALYANAIAKMAKELDAIALPNGKTLLDCTMIVLTGEVGTGDHNVVRKPGIVIGGGAKFTTGRAIKNGSFRKARSLRPDLPDWADDNVCEYTEASIWRLVAKAMGVSDLSGFGEPGRYAGADIA
jgi:Protein of unknown function (DUF1552)